jgi:hypothetical protein
VSGRAHVLSKETCLQNTEKDNRKVRPSSSLIKEGALKNERVLEQKEGGVEI